MSKVIDLLDSLGVAEDGISTVYPDTFTDDIRSAYEEDFSIPSAKIEVLTAELAAAQQEILALKAHNYELMVSVPATDDTVNESEDSEDSDDSSDDNDDNSGVDSLFKEKKDSE